MRMARPDDGGLGGARSGRHALQPRAARAWCSGWTQVGTGRRRAPAEGMPTALRRNAQSALSCAAIPGVSGIRIGGNKARVRPLREVFEDDAGSGGINESEHYVR